MIEKSKLIQWYEIEKLSLRNIAKITGYSPTTICRYIKKYGLKLRTSSSTPVDLTNKQKYYVRFIEPTKNRGPKGEIEWKCKCQCGKSLRLLSSEFSKTKSCGCIFKTCFKFRYKGFGQVSGTFLNKIRHSALKRGLDFDLNAKFLWNLFLKQDKKCVLSGLEIEILDRKGTASIDRIDSNKGYLQNNVQWTHIKVNMMKQNLTEKEFFELCSIIHRKNEGLR